MKLAVMHNRLSPQEDGRFQSFPRNSWREEFARAAQAGVPNIEWIDDTYGADITPLRTDEGVEEMLALMKKHGVSIPSICADSFMEEPLIRCTEEERAERLELLDHLFHQAKKVGAAHLGIPFLDNSALNTKEEIDQAALALQSILPTLEELDMELHLETSLDPENFVYLMQKINHPNVKITYDTGNSAGMGYNPKEEFAAYGEYLGSVHIKDRILNSATVELGTGDTDFTAVKEELDRLQFAGLFTLQGARGEEGGEVEQIRKYHTFSTQTFGVA